MTTSIVSGSLNAIAQQSNKTLAETFVNVDLIIIVDTSGSMDSHDSRGWKSRYDVACEELANLQATYPGKIAVLAFSNEVQFCPSGKPVFFGGGTDMEKALQFAKIADVPGMQFILISDGEPNNESRTLKVARTYRNKISTIYVGPEDCSHGRNFLDQLAAATGGKTVTANRAMELKANIEKLYLPG